MGTFPPIAAQHERRFNHSLTVIHRYRQYRRKRPQPDIQPSTALLRLYLREESIREGAHGRFALRCCLLFFVNID